MSCFPSRGVAQHGPCSGVLESEGSVGASAIQHGWLRELPGLRAEAGGTGGLFLVISG